MKIDVMEFSGQYRFLSNFWFSPVIMDSMLFNYVENAYQAAKTLDLTERRQFQFVSPSKAKGLGRKIKLRLDWEDVKLEVMETLLRQKFSPGSELHERLLKIIGDIQEGNTWGDKFWGVDLRTGQGKNMLGKLLMKIRDEARAA